jgi:D-alanyl-D-alanine carboxypeptidase
MNDKAQFLGMKNTKYLDSSGINDGNITTTKDLSILMDYAMRDATFREIIGTIQYTGHALNGGLVHNMTTTNRLLRTRTDVLAGKTGYSEAAGWNMITLFKAPSSGHRIVTVVMGTEGNDARFNESNKIIDWVYNYYRW